MNLHISMQSSSSLRLNDAECAAFARQRRRALFMIIGLSAVSWLVIGALIASFA